MKVLIAGIIVLASTFSWADGSQASSAESKSQPTPQTLPKLDESSTINESDSHFATGAKGLSGDDLSRVLDNSSETTVSHPSNPEEDKEQQEKLAAEKNWLLEGVRERRENEKSGLTEDRYTQLHDQALRSLAKIPEKADLIKNGLSAGALSPDGKTKQSEKSSEADNKNVPATLSPTVASLDESKTTPALGDIQKFAPAINGLSLDSLKPLDGIAEKTYNNIVASITASTPIETSNLSNLTTKSFTPIESSLPVSVSTHDFPTPNSEIAPSVQIPSTTINITPVTPISSVAPLASAPMIQIEPPHQPSVSNIPSVYKSKVADPADFLNNY